MEKSGIKASPTGRNLLDKHPGFSQNATSQ